MRPNPPGVRQKAGSKSGIPDDPLDLPSAATARSARQTKTAGGQHVSTRGRGVRVGQSLPLGSRLPMTAAPHPRAQYVGMVGAASRDDATTWTADAGESGDQRCNDLAENPSRSSARHPWRYALRATSHRDPLLETGIVSVAPAPSHERPTTDRRHDIRGSRGSDPDCHSWSQAMGRAPADCVGQQMAGRNRPPSGTDRCADGAPG